MRERLRHTAHGDREELLFHGTAHEHINTILSQGFLRDYNRTSRYGRGTYFANKASYSVAPAYCVPDAHGEQVMIVAHVLLGQSCKGDRSMRTPSAKPGPHSALYESMVDDIERPSIFVLGAGTDDHAYPAYVIRFQTHIRCKPGPTGCCTVCGFCASSDQAHGRNMHSGTKPLLSHLREHRIGETHDSGRTRWGGGHDRDNQDEESKQQEHEDGKHCEEDEEDPFSAPFQYRAGDVVYARWHGQQQWFMGSIVRSDSDGTFCVAYNDGDYETGVAEEHLYLYETYAWRMRDKK